MKKIKNSAKRNVKKVIGRERSLDVEEICESPDMILKRDKKTSS